MWDEITYPLPNFNGGTDEVCEWMSNLISHFTGHVIIYTCTDLIKSLLVKGAPGVLTMWDKLVRVSHGKWFLSPVLSKCHEIRENANIFVRFYDENSFSHHPYHPFKVIAIHVKVVDSYLRNLPNHVDFKSCWDVQYKNVSYASRRRQR